MRVFFWTAAYLILHAVILLLMGFCIRHSLPFGNPPKTRHYFLLLILIILGVIPMLGAFLPDSNFKYLMQAVGNIWLGILIYYALCLLVLVILFLLAGAVIHRPLNMGKCLIIPILLTALICSYGLIHAQHPVLKTYEVDIPSEEALPDMKIVLIADLHLSVNSQVELTKRMVELVNEQDADLILVAGDIFTSTYKGLKDPEKYSEVLRGLKARQGVYAVYGNHDVEEPLFGGFSLVSKDKALRPKEMEDFFKDSGFRLLYDEAVYICDGKAVLAGRIDGEKTGTADPSRMSAKELLKNMNTDLPVLVLEHEPEDYLELKEAGADLVLSGHTHNGQFFPGNLVVPLFNENGYGYKMIHGLHTLVTAGVGYYGPPMRIGTDSEVTVIDLHFTN